MHISKIALSCTLIFLGLALSAASPAPTRNHSAVTAADTTWGVDAVHSMVLFRVRHGVGAFWGRFNDVQGTAVLDPADPGKLSLDISVPVEGVDSGHPDLDRHLRSPDFFNEVEHPAMTFKSTGATPAGKDTWTLTGNLTLLGKTTPVTTRIQWLGSLEGRRGTKAGLEVEFAIKRSAFGMTYGIPEPGNAGGLGDEVRLVVGLELVERKAD